MPKIPDKKAAKKSKPSKRANKYEEKLKINGTFEDLMKALVTPKERPKQ